MRQVRGRASPANAKGRPGIPGTALTSPSPTGVAGAGRKDLLRLAADLLLEVGVQGLQEALRRQPCGVLADEQRQVLGHLAALDRLDADFLKLAREVHDGGGVVE